MKLGILAGKKVAIVGTSTSIMKTGYVPQLVDLLPDTKIANFSLGGCPSIYGSYVIEKERIAEDFDYVIIDFCINDQQLERSSFLSIESLVSSFGALLALFSPEKRCQPLVLLLPQRDAFKDDRLQKVRNLNRLLCQEFNVSVIDMFDLIEKSHQAHGTEIEVFFSDWTHMHQDFAQPFAELVANRLTELRATKNSELQQALPSYSVKVPTFLPSVERGTSLWSENTYVLTGERRFEVPIDGYLTGFVHWQNSDTGTLLLDAGEEQIALPARKVSIWDNRFAFSNFQTAVKCPSKVTMTVGFNEKYKFSRTFGFRADLPKDGSEIGICGFVVANCDPQLAGANVMRMLAGKELKAAKLSPAEQRFLRATAGDKPGKVGLFAAVKSLFGIISENLSRLIPR